MSLTIVNTGMPGAELGALRAAIDLGLQTGGWRCVDDDVPAIFAAPMRSSSSSDRGLLRRLCVQDSDGTLAISFGVVPLGVVAFVERAAEAQGNAWLHVTLPGGVRDGMPPSVLAEVRDWISAEDIATLHVTGPSEDDAPGIGEVVRREVTRLLEPLAAEELRAFTGQQMGVLGKLVDMSVTSIDQAGGTITAEPREPADGTLETGKRLELEASIRQAEREIRDGAPEPVEGETTARLPVDIPALIDAECAAATAAADRRERCLDEHGYGCARAECARHAVEPEHMTGLGDFLPPTTRET